MILEIPHDPYVKSAKWSSTEFSSSAISYISNIQMEIPLETQQCSVKKIASKLQAEIYTRRRKSGMSTQPAQDSIYINSSFI